ncbi:MAG: endonuclease/exonuclease/phosphatase family protein [Chloroflexota bacterium]
MRTRSVAIFILTLLCAFAAAAISLATVLGFLGRWWWRFDLLAHFRVQYFALLSVASLFLATQGQVLLAGIFSLFAVVNVGMLAPFYRPRARLPQRKTYRLLLANVLQENRRYGDMLELIERRQPDFVALIETGEHWIEALAPLRESHPFSVHEFWGEENYDIALFSKIAPDSFSVERFGPLGTPTLLGRFTLGGIPLNVIVTHPAPPKTAFETNARNSQLAELAGFLAAQQVATLLAGDLNITSWSPFFGRLLRQGNLRDSRIGYGIQASWPAASPFARVPIDHVLVSPDIQVHHRCLGPLTGSDHRPVLVDFSLLDKSPPNA